MVYLITKLHDVLAVLLGTVASGGGFWMPSRSSSVAESVDWIFDFILWISIFFMVLVTVLMVVFIIRYRHREGKDAKGAPSHNMALEITWSVIPLILVILIFWYAFEVYLDLTTPPEDAYEVLVTGQKWKWLFTYPNGYIDENLHVPVDTDVRLVMTSEDVIHSLFVPAFRVKQDVVPGRISKLWFHALESGEFDIYCAEYCGTSHSDMLATVVVHPPGEFEPWLEDASNFLDRMSPAEGGALLYTQRGCPQCHSVDGSANVGPTFLNLFGSSRQFADGTTTVADEEYIRESILEPQAKVVAGYEPVMPTFQGRLKDREVMAVIEYIKTLTPE
jgi:cytochrome c oxidase subunit 2